MWNASVPCSVTGDDSKGILNLPIFAPRRSLIGSCASEDGAKISLCSHESSFTYSVGGDDIDDAAASFLSWPMLSETGHNHVPHSSLTAAYSGVLSLPESLIEGFTNVRSDIEAGT
jgi:hypothetical protein